MGEAKRKRDAAYRLGPWPGGKGRCPRCFGTLVGGGELPIDADGGNFYARQIAVCGRCAIAWEPVDEALIWDRSDPHCSTSEPCNNCAFRPGSPEQRDTAEWNKTMASLRAGASFYCHKGVPLKPMGEHGFDYSKDQRQLRLCRGYLNALGRWWKRPKDDDLCIPDFAWDRDRAP